MLFSSVKQKVSVVCYEKKIILVMVNIWNWTYWYSGTRLKHVVPHDTLCCPDQGNFLSSLEHLINTFRRYVGSGPRSSKLQPMVWLMRHITRSVPAPRGIFLVLFFWTIILILTTLGHTFVLSPYLECRVTFYVLIIISRRELFFHLV
jgi:hypothetical protein